MKDIIEIFGRLTLNQLWGILASVAIYALVLGISMYRYSKTKETK